MVPQILRVRGSPLLWISAPGSSHLHMVEPESRPRLHEWWAISGMEIENELNDFPGQPGQRHCHLAAIPEAASWALSLLSERHYLVTVQDYSSLGS